MGISTNTRNLLRIIRKINRFAINPNITFYLNVSLEERLKRLQKTHVNQETFFHRHDNMIEEQKLYNWLINNWDKKKYGKLLVLNGHQNIMKIQSIIIDLVYKEFR